MFHTDPPEFLMSSLSTKMGSSDGKLWDLHDNQADISQSPAMARPYLLIAYPSIVKTARASRYRLHLSAGIFRPPNRTHEHLPTILSSHPSRQKSLRRGYDHKPACDVARPATWGQRTTQRISTGHSSRMLDFITTMGFTTIAYSRTRKNESTYAVTVLVRSSAALLDLPTVLVLRSTCGIIIRRTRKL
jgi:hypothetical protein